MCNGRLAESQPRHLGARGTTSADCAGGAIGAVTGHLKASMEDEDLAALGDGLGQGQAGLIIVYEVNMADRIAANMKSVNTVAVSKRIPAYADELAHQPHEAGAPG
jgi:Protein of unknown function (DUF1269)